ncbi:amino acid ABC transporter permease [Brucella pituitosa]|uniref:amino acid ABC transporter permease n=1 Tax=Brucella pituitosa TaxID=571256 RepID=UPI003F4AB8A4
MTEQTEFHILQRSHPWRWVFSVLLVFCLAALVYHVSRNDIFEFSVVPSYLFDPRIIDGVIVTFYLTGGSMLIGLVLGVVLAVMCLSANPVTRVLSSTFVWFFRGTPVLVQLIFWFNIGIIFPHISLGIPGGPVFFDISTNTVMTATVTALLGLGLNEAAYMSEIVRAGIQSVDRGQNEAAKALGLAPAKVLFRIVLPQALRVIIPPTGNQLISLLKTTSLVSVIAAGDLLTQSTRIYSENFRVLEMLVVASLWYLVLTSVASVGQYYVERRYSRGFAPQEKPRLVAALQRLRFCGMTGRTSREQEAAS